MPTLRINLDGDGAWADLANDLHNVIRLAEDARMEIVGLPGGTHAGRTSVAIRFELPDGRTVVAQTTLRLFLMAAAALAARYGTEGV